MDALIDRGHARADIAAMTIDQVCAFYGRALLGRIQYMADVRAAVWGDEEGYKKYVNGLTGRV